MTNQLVDMAFAVSVHEAVAADPKTTGDDVREFILKLKRIFAPFVFFFIALLICSFLFIYIVYYFILIEI